MLNTFVTPMVVGFVLRGECQLSERLRGTICVFSVEGARWGKWLTIELFK